MNENVGGMDPATAEIADTVLNEFNRIILKKYAVRRKLWARQARLGFRTKWVSDSYFNLNCMIECAASSMVRKLFSRFGMDICEQLDLNESQLLRGSDGLVLVAYLGNVRTETKLI